MLCTSRGRPHCLVPGNSYLYFIVCHLLRSRCVFLPIPKSSSTPVSPITVSYYLLNLQQFIITFSYSKYLRKKRSNYLFGRSSNCYLGRYLYINSLSLHKMSKSEWVDRWGGCWWQELKADKMKRVLWGLFFFYFTKNSTKPNLKLDKHWGGDLHAQI